LKKNKIPVAQFLKVSDKTNIEHAAKKFGYPLLLKARFDAYDGKGNFIIKNKNKIDEGLKKLQERKLYVEQFVPFVKEIAVMVARSTKRDIKVYPVVETIHKNNICDIVMAPAKISEIAKQNAQKIAKKVMEAFAGAGVFGIEMFLLKNDSVLINETAPRVHNSGHYTIEGCVTSQFEQHIRAITGLPLGSTDLIVPSVVMKNILGEKEGNGFPKGIENALKIPGISIHIYGKKESRIGRKMGHITVVGDTLEQCLKKANLARKYLII
jgi:phosphoribosylaminoimidazole carboxylase PurK protein